MTVMGIVLLVLGALLFAASFIVSDRGQDSSKSSKAMGLKLDRMIDERIEQVKGRLSDVASAAREEEEMKAQRELERLTNEKIMAIDDYSKVVLDEIEKNHKEAMFLYDMLDSKTVDIKNTIRKADAVKREQEDSIKENPLKEEPVKESAHQPIDDSSEPIRELLYSDQENKAVSGMERLKNAINNLTGSGNTDIPERKESVESGDSAPGAEESGEELSRNDRVLEMKKSGMDNVEIAKSLDMGVGEVNLITDLFIQNEEDSEV